MPSAIAPLPPDVNPLIQDHCDCLNEVLQSTLKTRQLAEACKRCGLEVSAASQQNDAQAEVAQKIKSEFFPTQP